MANIWQPSNQGELYHYGVIGMKWGVHKARSLDRKADRMTTKYGGTPTEDDDYPDFTSGKNSKQHAKIGSYRQKAASIRSKIDTKATRKLQKINARYEKRQARADRKFDKAERKSNSFLASERSARKAFRKASKEQFKANKIAARGKKWYERMVKEYKKAGLTMSKENQEIGKELVRQVRANSRAMYAATYVK